MQQSLRWAELPAMAARFAEERLSWAQKEKRGSRCIPLFLWAMKDLNLQQTD